MSTLPLNSLRWIARPGANRAVLPWLASVLALLGVLIGGCNTQRQDPEVVARGEQYLLASEPADAVTLTELAQRLSGPGEDPSAKVPAGEGAKDAASEPVVVVGRIYAGDLEPWDNGKASFLLAELPEQGHGEGHDADNCPFCKRKAAKAPTAIVQFLDEEGEVLGQDARKLFGVAKNDVVTIRGQAAAGDLNTLLITAEAIHVRGK